MTQRTGNRTRKQNQRWKARNSTELKIRPRHEVQQPAVLENEWNGIKKVSCGYKKRWL